MTMPTPPGPPSTYYAFIERYPQLREAWDLLHEAEKQGPLDEKTVRLVKLGIAIGAMREGAVHAGVRKALAQGVQPAAIEQLVALAASTIGMSSAVAIFSWVQDHLKDIPSAAPSR